VRDVLALLCASTLLARKNVNILVLGLGEIAWDAPDVLKVFEFLLPQPKNSKIFNARWVNRMVEETRER
jgi:hypothetical protein